MGSGAKMDVFVADYVCDSVGLKSEELVAIEDHSDEQWGFIKKRIKKRIKNFVKKSKKHFSRSKIHQYYKKYLSKYSKSRKKLKSWLKKRKMKGLVAIEDESDDKSNVSWGSQIRKIRESMKEIEEKHKKPHWHGNAGWNTPPQERQTKERQMKAIAAESRGLVAIEEESDDKSNVSWGSQIRKIRESMKEIEEKHKKPHWHGNAGWNTPTQERQMKAIAAESRGLVAIEEESDDKSNVSWGS